MNSIKTMLFTIACLMITSQFGIENIGLLRIILSVLLLVAFLGLLISDKK